MMMSNHFCNQIFWPGKYQYHQKLIKPGNNIQWFKKNGLKRIKGSLLGMDCNAQLA